MTLSHSVDLNRSYLYFLHLQERKENDPMSVVDNVFEDELLFSVRYVLFRRGFINFSESTLKIILGGRFFFLFFPFLSFYSPPFFPLSCVCVCAHVRVRVCELNQNSEMASILIYFVVITTLKRLANV